LLRQVEVVTGGASAAYGADALAGVVNFILDREFTGFELDVGMGSTDDGYGNNRDFSVAYGTEIGDKMHFIGSVQAMEIAPIDQPVTELGDWYRGVGHVENPAWTAGNTAAVRRLTLDNVHSTVHTPTGRINGGFDASGASTPFSLNALNFNYDGSGLRPFVAGDVVGAGTGNQSGGPEANIANLSFDNGPYGAEVKQRSVFAGLTIDANESTRLWVNLMAGETESNDWDRRGIPHGTTPWNLNIFVDNPFLPAGVRQTMINEGVDSFRMERQGQVLGQDGQWNDSEDRVNEYSGWTLQLGVDKQLGDNWNLQARIQRGATDRVTAVLNEVRIDREFLAIDAVEVYPDQRDLDLDGIPDLVAEADRGSGTIICNVQRYNPTQQQLQAAVAGFLVPAPQGDASLGGPSDRVPIPGPIGPDNVVRDCVPLNVLGQGNASPDAAAYVVSPKYGISAVTQEFAEILLTGDIADGIGAGPFGMAVGATYREQWFWQYGAPVDLMAYGPPRNAPNIGIRGISGGYAGGSPNLHEFSTVPVIGGGYDVWEAFAEFNFPLWESNSGGQRIEVDIAGRYSDYSTSGGINSNKVGLNFQVIPSLRFRATSSRDVREPTFAERFNRQGGGGNVRDPSPPAPFNAGDLFEITTTAGGNPNLAPEEADTVTAGFVLQPTGLPGFQLSMDWYEIDVDGLVGQLTQQEIVDNCFATSSPTVCGLVRRDQGLITNVDRVFLNIDSAKVRGIDYEVAFTAEPNLFSAEAETLSFRLLAGRLLEDSTVSGGNYDDNAGLFNEPDLTAIASVRYQIGDFGFNVQQRYIPETTFNNEWIEGVDVDDNTIEGQTTTDLTLFYQGSTGSGNAWQASLAISNLFDTAPPVIPGFGQRFSSQITGDNFDTYGRRYSVNFRYSF
jgi:outer membrane receptor protein involved in Fe transport